ncbi:MAG: septal ring lytic transglycosylase RlpA family protein [Parvularculaceae bacterium]
MRTSFPQFCRATLLAVVTIVAAGCATSPKEAARPDPHYKIGSPYEINGRRYAPREDASYNVVGTASWYGDAFHGKATANGEVFDKRRLSAAHTTLPLPSLVEVENLQNGRKAILRVNDRGPFVGDRIIDLSHASAIALGFEDEGLARVRVRYVGRADLYARAPLLGESVASPDIGSSSRTVTAPIAAAAPAGPGALPTPVAESTLPPVPAEPKPAVAAGPIPMEPARNEHWIVLDEFDDLQAAEVARSIVNEAEEVRVTSPGARARYSFEIGPYQTRAAAEARLAALREAGYLEARLAGRSAGK